MDDVRRRVDLTTAGMTRAGACRACARAEGLVLLVLLATSPMQAQICHNMEIMREYRPPVNCSGGNSLWGRSLSSGDFNGDGYSDIVFTYDSIMWRDTIEVRDSGCYKARVYYGSPTGPNALPDLVIARTESRGFDGATGIGDINGDGYDDLALPRAYDNCVYIYLGGNPMDTIPDYVLAESGTSGYGWPVAHGDLNHDGYSDLIVNGGYVDGGIVFVYFGGPHFDVQADVVLHGGHDGWYEGFGANVASSGDLNGDGFDDLVVGAPNYGGGFGYGRIYVYYGGNPMDTICDVSISNPRHACTSFGESGISILRRDGDFDCLAVGANLGGDAFIFYGGSPMDSVPDLTLARHDNTDFGCSMRSAGRLDGGRYDGFILGAPLASECFGTAYLWTGARSFDSLPNAWVSGDTFRQFMGAENACAGDVDNDGRDEVLLAPSGNADTAVTSVWLCKYTGPVGVAALENSGIRRRALRIAPNPCTDCALLSFDDSEPGAVEFRILDASGRDVRTLRASASAQKPASARWDLTDNSGRRIPSGAYFVQARQRDLRCSAATKIVVRR